MQHTTLLIGAPQHPTRPTGGRGGVAAARTKPHSCMRATCDSALSLCVETAAGICAGTRRDGLSEGSPQLGILHGCDWRGTARVRVADTSSASWGMTYLRTNSMCVTTGASTRTLPVANKTPARPTPRLSADAETHPPIADRFVPRCARSDEKRGSTGATAALRRDSAQP